MMTAKDYLKRTLLLAERIRSLEKRLEYSDAASTGLVTCYGRETVMHTRKTDSMESTIVSCAVFTEELRQKRMELEKMKDECRVLIENVPEPDERLILQLRYISLSKWHQIASVMCLSKRMVWYKHGDAIKSFEAVNAEQLKKL